MSEPHEQRKADYIAASSNKKLAAVQHRNAVAKALGEGRPVSAAVLSDYHGTDWSKHPLSRNYTKPSRRKVGFYELGLTILAAEMTGFERGDAEQKLPVDIARPLD